MLTLLNIIIFYGNNYLYVSKAKLNVCFPSNLRLLDGVDADML